MGPIFLLTLAGAASGLLAMLVDTPLVNPPWSFLIVGTAFGCVFAGYLWFHEGERMPGRLIGMVFGSIVALFVTVMLAVPGVLVAMMTGQPTFAFIFGPVLGGAGGAWVISSVFLRLLRSPHHRMGTEVAWATGTGLVLGPVGVLATVLLQSTATAVVIWQGGIACALGIASYLRSAKL